MMTDGRRNIDHRMFLSLGFSISYPTPKSASLILRVYGLGTSSIDTELHANHYQLYKNITDYD